MAEQQQHSEIPTFDLPDPLLAVLPKDPFEQLNIARKITSIALASRVSSLEAEASRLRLSLASKDNAIADLTSQLENLDASLDDLSGKLARAEEEKERLVGENADLSNTVKKLNRDVSKLEVFKKALMQSLQEEDGSQVGAPRAVSQQSKNNINFTTESLSGEEGPTATSKSYSAQSQFPETRSSEDGAYGELDTSRQSLLPTLSLGSLSHTPKLTPPGSPPRHSRGGTPKTLSKPVSPRRSRHSISLPSTRNMFEERPSVYSSMPSTHSSSMSSPFDTGAQTGRTRVDGKEFFRQVRSRLSYEQFSAFLANVKELNAHKQTREETLRKADEIFGPNNKDLYAIFESLISRNL